MEEEIKALGERVRLLQNAIIEMGRLVEAQYEHELAIVEGVEALLKQMVAIEEEKRARREQRPDGRIGWFN